MRFTELYNDKIQGAISGFDRVRFRGTVRWLANEHGMNTFLSYAGVLLKDFGKWVEGKTKTIRNACKQQAEQMNIEMIYLKSGAINKEQLARQIALEKGIVNGPICMFSVVEPCRSPAITGNRASKKLELKMRPRKCIWIYHYWNDPEIGFGHVRVQTWLPLTVHICINGRHWLEQQLSANNMAYVKDGNCFPWIEDVDGAQRLMNEQLKTDWPALLNRLTKAACPILSTIYCTKGLQHYWSADETEWATDIMFNSAKGLDALYPSLIRHGMNVSDSPSVMRYLGKRDIQCKGMGAGRAPNEIISDCRRRYEGVRIKHWVNRNSVKMYNKSSSILRAETTINNPREFKVYRSPNDDESKPASYQKMRKGVSDLHRRAQVSEQSNVRYLNAISAAHVEQTLKEVVNEACNPCVKKKKRYRALNPWTEEDFKLLTFLAKGENVINGFLNRDLRECLYPKIKSDDKKEQKKYTSRTSYRIRLLRGHGLIRKIPKENRYVLSEKGREFSTVLMVASSIETKELMKMAA